MPPASIRHIIISRTDSIGDVMLTLPMAAVLRQYLPGVRISFLGRSYTRPVIEACPAIDAFIDRDDFLAADTTTADAIIHVFPVADIAKKAKTLRIPWRIGTTNRLYHWTTCNKLVKLSRKNSDLHEAQLNLKLLEPLGLKTDWTLPGIQSLFSFAPVAALRPGFAALVAPDRYNLILHPKSQGSAREWGLDHFASLVQLLPPEQFKIFISGTDKERLLLNPLMDAVGERVTDITGLMKLDEFISFISHCDGLVANSTGPLHLAAALGKDALGLYPPMRPIHPGRWAPIGRNVKIFVLDKSCSDCRKQPEACHCIRAIPAEALAAHLQQCRVKKFL